VPLFAVVVLLLIAVDVFGHIGKGAQRWLDLGFMKFQPSEVMKLSMPIMVAAWLSRHSLPPKFSHVMIALVMVLLPTLLIAAQPDLGTSILVAASGFFVIFLAGISWWLIGLAVLLICAFMPVLVLPDARLPAPAGADAAGPEKDRSVAAITSSSPRLRSAPAACSARVAARHPGRIPARAPHRLHLRRLQRGVRSGGSGPLAGHLPLHHQPLPVYLHAGPEQLRTPAGGALTLTFFVYVFVNMGMVSGILPVVEFLPLVSYGGNSMVTLMAGFGVLMSIQTHRRLLA
jgi:rod shape determining protein RodA